MRVSTLRQGRSGLGLDAQRAACAISGPAVRWMIDNTDLDAAMWACDVDCWSAAHIKDIAAGLGELEIKPESLRYIICASRDLLGLDEVNRLMEAASADPETHVIVCTLLAGGLRRAELLGLAFDAIDFESATITIRRTVIEGENGEPLICDHVKTESSVRTRHGPGGVARPVAGTARPRERGGAAVGRGISPAANARVPGIAGTPVRPANLTDRLRRLMKQAGVSGRQPTHAWRHTAGTSLYDATKNVKMVQHRLGHSTPKITLELYVHPIAERDQEAAEHLGTLIRRS